MNVCRHLAYPEKIFPSLAKYSNEIIHVTKVNEEMVQCNILLGCLHMFQIFKGFPITPSEPGSNSFALLSTLFGFVPAGAVFLNKENQHYKSLVASAILNSSEKAQDFSADFNLNSNEESFEEKIQHWLSIDCLGIKEIPSSNVTANQIKFCENLKKTLHKDENGIFTIGLIKNEKLQPTPTNYKAVKNQTIKISKQLTKNGIK